MTFSIVAVDRENKEVGFAIASCCWNSGAVCRAEPETGAIASQASGNLSFLPLFFDKLKERMSLNDILNHFREVDEDIETRQVGMITLEGEKLAFTGDKCDSWAGHKTGENYSCQGNTLVGMEVIENMVTAFEETKGPLIDKLYAALQAGDDAGGDARGKQSARLQVLKNGRRSGSDVLIDITIEDNPEPIKEIRRILDVRSMLIDGYQLFIEFSNAADEDKPGILEKIEKFLEDKTECRYSDFWTGLGAMYYEIGNMEKAVKTFRKSLEISPALIKSLKGNAEKGLLPKELADLIFENRK
jgi:uncharacterized Ntn-hydrolase superfamily protein